MYSRGMSILRLINRVVRIRPAPVGANMYGTKEVAKRIGLGLRMTQRLCAKLGFRSFGRAYLLTEQDIETLREWRRDHPVGLVPKK